MCHRLRWRSGLHERSVFQWMGCSNTRTNDHSFGYPALFYFRLLKQGSNASLFLACLTSGRLGSVTF